MKYRSFILKAEYRFRERWEPKPGQHPWPNARFFIHAQEIKDEWPVSLQVQGYFAPAGSLFGLRGGKITGAKRGPFVTDRPKYRSWDKYEITSRTAALPSCQMVLR